MPSKIFRFMVVKKYLTVLSGKYPANLYWIPDSAGCLNFTGYRIPVSGSGTSLILLLSCTSVVQIYEFSPSRRREAPCEGSNPPRLFTPGETKALAGSKVHQISRAWVTNDGWSSSLISKIWRTVMNSGH